MIVILTRIHNGLFHAFLYTRKECVNSKTKQKTWTAMASPQTILRELYDSLVDWEEQAPSLPYPPSRSSKSWTNPFNITMRKGIALDKLTSWRTHKTNTSSESFKRIYCSSKTLRFDHLTLCAVCLSGSFGRINATQYFILTGINS